MQILKNLDTNVAVKWFYVKKTMNISIFKSLVVIDVLFIDLFVHVVERNEISILGFEKDPMQRWFLVWSWPGCSKLGQDIGQALRYILLESFTGEVAFELVLHIAE